jgi:ABC-type amino acid transport substrate-binding protein
MRNLSKHNLDQVSSLEPKPVKSLRVKTTMGLLVTVFSVTLALVGCVPSNEPSSTQFSGVCGDVNSQSLETISVGYGRTSDGPSMEWGISEACFAKFGIMPSGKQLEGAEGIAGMENGEIDILAMSITELAIITANSNFKPVVVASSTGYTQAELDDAKQEPLAPNGLKLQVGVFVSPSSTIQTWTDLKGKTIAVESRTGVAFWGTELALMEAGISDGEIEYLVLPSESRFAALDDGSIDAVISVGSGAAKALEAGYRLIGYPGAFIYSEGPVKIWVTTEEILQEKSSLIEAFRAAVLEVNEQLQQPENAESFRSVLVGKFEVDPDVAANTPIPGFWTPDLDQAYMRTMTSRLIQTGAISKGGQDPIILD